ncbi:aryl-sulfate sulfohydrolase [Blastopirellula marina]|uniref:Aryl-sulfate sulfohydrolase n=1 Tax=Blastopirellula marina TaxID=124 RepID=A0A2S8G377_9BACT|nr:MULTISPECIES: sulfatase [Pirellulaceae]PQO38905.1 aryl-sulfate sulfohydrolase [Blastopirellula marina]RCS55213.1 aryl-sulfate sulfohydrolase [Bremerella cremea]
MLRLILFALLISCAVASPSYADDRPNFVLIYADDLGWKDVGYQGSDFYETPVIDSLAKQGMTFTAGYACAGNCAPSRACLLSGQYTPRHHLYAVGSTNRGAKNEMRLNPIPNHDGLSADNLTLAEALKGAGYVTGHFGKWHLSGKDGADPTEQGFDESYDSFGDGELKEGTETNKAGPPSDPKGVFTLTDKACAFIEKNRDRPFFCYLPHHAIHGPLQGQPKTVAHFEAKPKGENHKSAMYAACTYDLDESVGRLLAKLDELKLADKTMVIFTSDNGATPQSLQEPLRGNKGGYYEGGIREPFIIRWPGKVKPGSTCDVPVIQVDIYPTILAAAGIDVPQGKVLDGESLLPLLTGEGQLDRTAIFWHFPGYLDRPVTRGRPLDVRTGFRSRPVTVINKDHWKLHLFHEEWVLDGGADKLPGNGAVELYDLRNDIGERHDLAASSPEKRDELLADVLRWHKSVGALIPTEPNPKYAPGPAKMGKGKKKK